MSEQLLKRILSPAVAFAMALSAGGSLVIGQDNRTYDVLEKSITDLQADMTAGRVSAAQLVDIYQRRISAYD